MSAADQNAPDGPGDPSQLLETPHLADALESDRFKQFLDHIPFAVVVAELQPEEHITYANLEFERLTGKACAAVEGGGWECLDHCLSISNDGARLSQVVLEREDYVGVFRIEGDDARSFDAWSNLIQGEDGAPVFRLVALADTSSRRTSDDLEQQLHEKDTLLRELQHRVKNNLQMITALIRMEARNGQGDTEGDRFDRLAGRIGALSLLYGALSADASHESVDLGVYLTQIASAVMQAHASEGVRLDMKVDAWPV